VSLTPRQNPPAGEGSMGVTLEAITEKESYPIYIAWWEGLKQAFGFAWLILASLGGIIGGLISTGGTSAELAGPIGIASLVGQTRELGFIPVLFFAGIISINLAVVNVLPFPALDGGRLLFVIIEAVL